MIRVALTVAALALAAFQFFPPMAAPRYLLLWIVVAALVVAFLGAFIPYLASAPFFRKDDAE